MQTLYGSVAMPRDLDEPEQELERRLAGTGLDWEHDFQNYYRIRVSSEVLGEDELLESARGSSTPCSATSATRSSTNFHTRALRTS